MGIIIITIIIIWVVVVRREEILVVIVQVSIIIIVNEGQIIAVIVSRGIGFNVVNFIGEEGIIEFIVDRIGGVF